MSHRVSTRKVDTVVEAPDRASAIAAARRTSGTPVKHATVERLPEFPDEETAAASFADEVRDFGHPRNHGHAFLDDPKGMARLAALENDYTPLLHVRCEVLGGRPGRRSCGHGD